MSVHYVGGSDTSGSHPLNNDAIFRIEVSLSSQKSSVVVMRCTARLYSLEGMKETTSNQSKMLYILIPHSPIPFSTPFSTHSPPIPFFAVTGQTTPLIISNHCKSDYNFSIKSNNQ